MESSESLHNLFPKEEVGKEEISIVTGQNYFVRHYFEKEEVRNSIENLSHYNTKMFANRVLADLRKEFNCRFGGIVKLKPGEGIDFDVIVTTFPKDSPVTNQNLVDLAKTLYSKIEFESHITGNIDAIKFPVFPRNYLIIPLWQSQDIIGLILFFADNLHVTSESISKFDHLLNLLAQFMKRDYLSLFTSTTK